MPDISYPDPIEAARAHYAEHADEIAEAQERYSATLKAADEPDPFDPGEPIEGACAICGDPTDEIAAVRVLTADGQELRHGPCHEGTRNA